MEPGGGWSLALTLILVLRERMARTGPSSRMEREICSYRALPASANLQTKI